jgi:hypothetical protein
MTRSAPLYEEATAPMRPAHASTTRLNRMVDRGVLGEF